jgi:hypothetical protein
MTRHPSDTLLLLTAAIVWPLLSCSASFSVGAAGPQGTPLPPTTATTPIPVPSASMTSTTVLRDPADEVPLTLSSAPPQSTSSAPDSTPLRSGECHMDVDCDPAECKLWMEVKGGKVTAVGGSMLGAPGAGVSEQATSVPPGAQEDAWFSVDMDLFNGPVELRFADTAFQAKLVGGARPTGTCSWKATP